MASPSVARHADSVKPPRLALLASVCCAMQGVLVAAVAAPSDIADAVMQRDSACLQVLLKAHGEVNAPQPDGSTALHWAAYEGDAHLAALLLGAVRP